MFSISAYLYRDAPFVSSTSGTLYLSAMTADGGMLSEKIMPSDLALVLRADALIYPSQTVMSIECGRA